MATKIYSLIIFLSLYSFMCLYIGFKTQKKVVVPVDFFIFGRQLPGWSYLVIVTGQYFLVGYFLYSQSNFIRISIAMTSLFVVAVSLIGILFAKRQWMFQKIWICNPK